MTDVQTLCPTEFNVIDTPVSFAKISFENSERICYVLLTIEV